MHRKFMYYSLFIHPFSQNEFIGPRGLTDLEAFRIPLTAACSAVCFTAWKLYSFPLLSVFFNAVHQNLVNMSLHARNAVQLHSDQQYGLNAKYKLTSANVCKPLSRKE